MYTPTADGKQDNIFITKSYDATTHFETVAEDVADVWERITVSFPRGGLGTSKADILAVRHANDRQGEKLSLEKSDVEIQG